MAIKAMLKFSKVFPIKIKNSIHFWKLSLKEKLRNVGDEKLYFLKIVKLENIAKSQISKFEKQKIFNMEMTS